MIQIISKEDCMGCNACAQRCPKTCITMHEDHEGFLYPVINNDVCIDCGICELVCPVLNIAKQNNSMSNNEAYAPSVFPLLGKNVDSREGIVTIRPDYSGLTLCKHTCLG